MFAVVLVYVACDLGLLQRVAVNRVVDVLEALREQACSLLTSILKMEAAFAAAHIHTVQRPKSRIGVSSEPSRTPESLLLSNLAATPFSGWPSRVLRRGVTGPRVVCFHPCCFPPCSCAI